jgi:hypothetical protein
MGLFSFSSLSLLGLLLSLISCSFLGKKKIKGKEG